MNKKELRTKFVQLSGRYDLMKDDYSDNGADFFLENGQKFIDGLLGATNDEEGPGMARFFKSLVTDDIGATFQNCRAIKRVWLTDSTGQVELNKKTITWMKENIYTKPFSDITVGVPQYYSPAMLRMSPDASNLSASDIDAIDDYFDIVLTNQHRYRGVLIGPPCNGSYTLEVQGLFYTAWPSEETGETFWMYNHPDILIQAGIYKLETFMRNTEGMNDMLLALQMEVDNIDKDIVEEQIAKMNQIEGITYGQTSYE